MFKILCPEKKNFSEKFINKIKIHYNATVLDLNREEILSKVWDIEILAIRFTTIVDANLLKIMPNLKFIICPTTGLDHISLDLMEKNNILLLSLKGEKNFINKINATPEHTFALILCLIRNIIPSYNEVLKGNWSQSEFRGTELFKKTIGIVGMGRVGKKIANFSTAFGMRVLYFDPYVNIKPYEKVYLLEDLAKKSDVVSIHIPLNNENVNIINKDFFSKMKKNSIFINTSRADVIDNLELVNHLKNNKIYAAALDVVEKDNLENFVSQNLLSYAKKNKNLIITPHIAGNTEESVELTDMFVLSKLRLELNHGRGNS